MFETSTSSPGQVASGKAIVFQDKMTIYARPFPEAEVVTILDKGKVFEFQAPEGEIRAGWHSIRTMEGQTGFIKATTKTTTREKLYRQRLELEQGIQLGMNKMFTGVGIALVGGILMILPFLGGVLPSPGVEIYVYGGLICVGVGQFFWGLEQRANAIRALHNFNAGYQPLLG